MTNEWINVNNRSRQRLGELVARLTEAELVLAMPDGWTVASLLAHLAFWDLRALALIKRWQEEGLSPSPIDIDDINEAVKPILLALDPHTAASLALEAAWQVDQALTMADPALIQAIEGLGGKFRLDRSLHRTEHLDQIEIALKSQMTDH